VTPEANEHFDKARQCLICARTILAAGIGECAGGNAYLAASHAAQALIAERAGKDAKTHKGVHAQFARLTRNEPRRGKPYIFPPVCYIVAQEDSCHGREFCRARPYR